jgi:hypothetical protein
MNTIGAVTCGIKALEGVLNNMVVAINRRTIDTGAGLTKTESESGIVICLESGKNAGNADPGTQSGTSDDPWRKTPDGETAKWHQVEVMDDSCNRLTMWVWGGTPS